MAYIEKVRDKFRAHVERNGQRRSKVFDTKRLAQEWAKRTELELLDTDTLAFTFGEACTKYLAEVSINKTLAWEQRRIEAFKEHFHEDTLLANIQAPQIAQWRDDRLQTVKPDTVLREKNLLSNIFTKARQEWHWCTHNPFTGVQMPKPGEERELIWRWQDIKKVLRAPVTGKTKETVDAFHIALRTSLRLQEVLVSPTLFNKERQVVVIPPEYNKTKRTETVPIGRIAAKLLQRPPFQVEANEASVLFSDLKSSLGIKELTFHDSRATALTFLARKVDVMRLAKISRHRDIRILQRRYFRERPDDISKVI